MGDASDMADVGRFMRSPEGVVELEKLRRSLVDRTITGIGFSSGINTVLVEVELDNGSSFTYPHPDFEVDRLREDFESVLEREYYKDYPERLSSG